jgi:hypothetical protein
MAILHSPHYPRSIMHYILRVILLWIVWRMGISPLARDDIANDPDNGASELPSRSRQLRMAVEPVYCGQRTGIT